jgi:hypothetical protein
MMRLPTRLGGAVLAVLVFMPNAARADLIHWTYDWSASPRTINANSPGTGTITLTNEAHNSATGDSDIVATNLRVHSNATSANPDIFSKKSYSLTLVLTDTASGASGTLVFTGQLSGTATVGSANITNTFTGIGVQSMVLGDNQYTVAIGPFTPPGPPNAINSGSIGAHAKVVIHHLPEPGAIVLGSIGISLLGLTWLRRFWSSIAA